MDPAALASVLHHGAVPTEAQAVELRHLLDAGEAEVSQLERTTATLSLLLAEVKSQSTRRAEALAPLRGALSALRRFPAETLGEIFIMCAEDSRASASRNRTNTAMRSIADPRWPPLLLGHVCSRWRAVSHGLPRLWNQVVLPATAFVDANTASVVRDLLERSQNLPLSISTAHLSSRVPWNSVPYLPSLGNTSFFRVLLETSHNRLKEITLEINSMQIAVLAPHLATTASFPTLTSLTLVVDSDFHHTWRDLSFASILNGFQHAPFLNSLDLSCWAIPVTTPLARSSFPWTQLKKLRVEIDCTISDARNTLMGCPQLECARFYLVEGRRRQAEESIGATPALMRNLRELYFSVEYDSPSTVFFEAFTFPHLQKLCVDVGYLSMGAFQDFYQRSNFELRYLHLERSDDMSADELFALIRLSPTLENINIINCRCLQEPALYQIFTHHSPGVWRPIALPALTTLALGLDYDSDGVAVADMAECLFEHGGRDSPFPLLDRLYLENHRCEAGARYEDGVENRLACIAATGFLIRKTSREPGDFTAYTKEDGHGTQAT